MKPKHFGLTAICVVITIVGVVLWLDIRHRQTLRPAVRVGTIRPLSELNVPGKSVLERMDRLERHMHLLSAPPPRIRPRADLSALGYQPVVGNPVDGGGAGGGRPPEFTHRVTMAFDGQVKRYCIIDDTLYPEGAVLPDGATIMKIESTRVLIAKESLQQWLDVDLLLDTTAPEES